MTPEEALKAAEDSGAEAFVPTHVRRFSIANHAWDEPFRRIIKSGKGKALRILTPEIGELFALDDKTEKFIRWRERSEIND